MPEIVTIDSTQASKKEKNKREKQPSPFWLLLTKHPVVGEILLRGLQIITGLYLFVFGLGSLAMPFVFFFDEGIELSSGEEMNTLFMTIAWLFYVILTYLLYRGYKRIKIWINGLRSDARLREIGKQEQNLDPIKK